MNLVVALLIVVGSVGFSVAALLFVRRRAPDGGYFHDGDRAAGVFGVLATGFSVLLGFIVFLAFTSYDLSRTGAEAEALLARQQYVTAQFFPKGAADELTGELICYARYVVHREWPQMERGGLEAEVNPWGIEMFKSLKATEPESVSEQAAYGKWLDQATDRETARLDRVHAADGIIPWPLTIVLYLSACVIFVFMLFFADSGERAVVQALQIGTVVGLIVTTLLVIGFLDDPYKSGGVGGVQPVEMKRTLKILEQELAGVGEQGTIPCSASGDAL